MATSEQIIKPIDPEIIPRPNLVGVEIAIRKLANETAKFDGLKLRAEAILKVAAISATPEQCAEAKALQLEVKTLGKAAGLALDSYWQVVKAALDALSQIYTNHEGKAEAIDGPLKTWVQSFEAEETKRAQQEQDRINAENARIVAEKAEAERKQREQEAEEKKKERVAEIKAAQKRGEIGKREAAKLMREVGADAEAAIEQAAADAEIAKNTPPPQVTVKPNIPKQAGVPSRKNYKAELKDPEAIIAAYVRTFAKPVDLERRIFLRKFIMINEQKLGEEARDTKDSKKMAALIPGVRFYED